MFNSSLAKTTHTVQLRSDSRMCDITCIHTVPRQRSLKVAVVIIFTGVMFRLSYTSCRGVFAIGCIRTPSARQTLHIDSFSIALLRALYCLIHLNTTLTKIIHCPCVTYSTMKPYILSETYSATQMTEIIINRMNSSIKETQ